MPRVILSRVRLLDLAKGINSSCRTIPSTSADSIRVDASTITPSGRAENRARSSKNVSEKPRVRVVLFMAVALRAKRTSFRAMALLSPSEVRCYRTPAGSSTRLATSSRLLPRPPPPLSVISGRCLGGRVLVLFGKRHHSLIHTSQTTMAQPERSEIPNQQDYPAVRTHLLVTSPGNSPAPTTPRRCPPGCGRPRPGSGWTRRLAGRPGT